MLNVSIVLDEELMLDNFGDFVNACIVLFGLLYALILEYNEDLKGLFTQKGKSCH